jgi:hypothetical protein
MFATVILMELDVAPAGLVITYAIFPGASGLTLGHYDPSAHDG